MLKMKGYYSINTESVKKCMKFSISFPGTTSFKSWAEVLEFSLSVLYFVPKTIINQDFEYELFEKNEAINMLNTYKRNHLTIADDFYFWHDEKNMLTYQDADNYTNTQCFSFWGETINSEILNDIIGKAHKKDFFMGYYYNPLNTLNQNEEIVSNLEIQNIPHDHLPKKWDPVLEKEVIDTFQNPGHERLTYGTWIYAAPEMWFGKAAWQYFDKEKLKKYTKAVDIRELEEDLVYIKLFDPYSPDYETKEILELQADFREYSEMNRIEKDLEELKRIKNEENYHKRKALIKRI